MTKMAMPSLPEVIMKISSPVVVIAAKQRFEFEDGQEAYFRMGYQGYVIHNIYPEDGVIVIELVSNNKPDNDNPYYEDTFF